MEKKNFLILFVMLLSFSYLLYASAIPVTRTKNLNGEVASFIPSLAKQQGSLKIESGEEMKVDMDENFMERRIDLDIQDYGGTGANTDHDPKTPGIH